MGSRPVRRSANTLTWWEQQIHFPHTYKIAFIKQWSCQHLELQYVSLCIYCDLEVCIKVAASCMSYVTTFFFPGAGMCIHDPVSLLHAIPRTYQSPVPICKAIPDAIALLISVFCVLPYILSRQICPCLRFFSTSVPEKTMQNQI